MIFSAIDSWHRIASMVIFVPRKSIFCSRSLYAVYVETKGAHIAKAGLDQLIFSFNGPWPHSAFLGPLIESRCERFSLLWMLVNQVFEFSGID